MKRIISTLSVIALLAGLGGCCSPRCRPACGPCGGPGYQSCSDAGCDTCSTGCESCGPADCGMCSGAGCGSCCKPCGAVCGGMGCLCGAGYGQEAFTPGPPSAAITYPYYTVRGPRDFLAETPPSIGP